MDPTLQGAVWFPVFSIITIICVSVYVRMWVLARRARTQIQDLSVGVGGAGAGAGAAAMLHKAQRKTTLSLLLVSGVYLSTNVGEDSRMGVPYVTSVVYHVAWKQFAPRAFCLGNTAYISQLDMALF